MLAFKVVHAIYKRYEYDVSRVFHHLAFLVVLPYSISLLASSASRFENISSYNTYSTCVFSFGLYYLTLISSIIIYRLSPWHPLAKYPGPLLAKLTKLWGVYQTAQGTYHLKTKELHERYGPFVRIGTLPAM